MAASGTPPLPAAVSAALLVVPTSADAQPATEVVVVAVGDHEYLDPGVGAPGFFTYFARGWRRAPTRAGGPTSATTASTCPTSWHVVALNSDCGRDDPAAPACGAGSAQVACLQADLQAHAGTRCMLAYWHHPRRGSGFFNDDANVALFWSALNHVHADLIVDGHESEFRRTDGVVADRAGAACWQ